MAIQQFLARVGRPSIAIWVIAVVSAFAQQESASKDAAPPPATDTKPAATSDKDVPPQAGAAANSTELPRIDPAAQLLERLKPEKLNALAEMIEEDWQDRPEWAEMALAIMRNQAMQPGGGWWRASDKKYGWTWLKRKYDRNSDNVIDSEEFSVDNPRHEQFLRRLDRDLDGKIKAADFDVSVFQAGSPDALKARMTDFLFQRLDTDTNGQVTQKELAKFFEKADREKSAFLTTEDLLEALSDLPPQRS